MRREARGSKAPVVKSMTCEEVRQHLADYTLGTLAEWEMAGVRRHLRGCGGCRAEAAQLDQGISLFATAAHVAEPPTELKDRVMSALAEEWSEGPAEKAQRRAGAARWLAVAAAVVAVAGALTWAGFSQVQASRSRSDAARYRSFLGALGGREVRVAALKAASGTAIEGSAILYDSDHGQSWILVLARAPGYSGPVEVTVSAPGGPSIQMRPLQLDAEGDASSWLVTSSDISRFTTVTLRSAGGSVLASGVAVSQD
jgi:hypothetical protein